MLEDRDERGDEVVDAIDHRITLRLEEEHLLKMLLQEARALDVALEVGRRAASRVDEAARLALRELVLERARDLLLDRGDVELGRLRGDALDRARGPGEELEQARRGVLGREPPLALHLVQIAFARRREPRARLLDHAHGGLDPQPEPRHGIDVLGRERRDREPAVAGEALAHARQARGQAHHVPAQAVHGARVRARIGLIEARELLQALPRRVLREQVRRDLDLEVDRVRGDAVAGHRERHAPLEAGRVVYGDADVAGRRLLELEAQPYCGCWACHCPVTQPLRPRLSTNEA